jgi:hypothetical protein
MPSPDRADLERLLRLGLSLRHAAGALRVYLGAALAAIDKGRRPARARRPARGKPLGVAEGAA